MQRNVFRRAIGQRAGFDAKHTALAQSGVNQRAADGFQIRAAWVGRSEAVKAFKRQHAVQP